MKGRLAALVNPAIVVSFPLEGFAVGAQPATVPANAADLSALAQHGTPDAVQAAIRAGADVNAVDKDGQTPLMDAASRNENPDVAVALLKAGASNIPPTIKSVTDWAGAQFPPDAVAPRL